MTASTPTLLTFDRDIDEKIIKRGLTYFRKNRVQELAEVEDGVWRALVQGKEAYNTTITIRDGEIVHHRCSCPYDLGQYCKHEVAMLYALSALLHDDSEETPAARMQRKASTSSGKKRSEAAQIRDAVGSLSENELRSIVIEQAISDPALHARLVESTITVSAKSQTPSEKKEEYIDIIRACMDDNADRHGFTGWSEAYAASKAAHELCGAAQRHVNDEKYEKALPIGQALLEAIYPDLGHMDDSDGSFGSCIECGWETLRKIADNIPPANTVGMELFSYCLSQAGRKEYDGWSTEKDFLSIAQKLTHSEERLQKLFSVIDATMLAIRGEDDPEGLDLLQETKDFMREKDEEDAISIKIAALRKLDKAEEADELVRSSLQYPDIREMYVEDLIARNELETAKKIAREGIEHATYPGTVRRFEEWLVTIAEREGDGKTVKLFLQQFFLERMEMDAFRRWKSSYEDASSWQNDRDKIIKQLQKNDAVHTLLSIYQEEELWDEFRDTVLQQGTKLLDGAGYLFEHALTFLLRYEEEMMERCPDQYAPLVFRAIPSYLTGNTGRSTYQEICRVLRRMRKCGYEEDVETTCQTLAERFKNRPALKEELATVS